MFTDLTRDDVLRLETRDLWLRWPRQADAARIAVLSGDKAVAGMTANIPHPNPPHAAAQFIEQARAANEAGTALTLAMTMKASPDEVVGMIGVEQVSGDAELGYWIGQPFWGRGFATQAVRALVDMTFVLTDVPELLAAARVINPASRRVLEKAGFAFLGSGLRRMPARGGSLPVDRFALSRRDWESMRDWRVTSVPRQPLPAVSEPAACCA